VLSQSNESNDPDLLKTPNPNIEDFKKEAENNKNLSNFHSKSEGLESNDSGFISRVSNFKINSPDRSKLVTSIRVEEKPSYRPIVSRTQLFGEEKQNFPVQQRPAPSTSILQKKEEDPIRFPMAVTRRPLMDSRPPITSYRSTILENESKETPFKSNQSEQYHFVTPSARPLSSTLKSNFKPTLPPSTEERETNKKPKVLFTTPKINSTRDVMTPIMRNLSPLYETPRVDENVLVIKNVEYLLDKRIGSGGSSVVFLARGRRSGKECAIKVVNLNGDEPMVESYLNETKLLARLQGNINVIELYDYCHMPEKRVLYMIMEKGDSDLHRILQTYETHIPLYTLMNYWHQMLQAVDYIHQNGVIHSDLKPANFLMSQGRLKLIDFGIASNIAIDSTSIIKFSQAGTFNYISPEALIDTSTGDSPISDHKPRIRLSMRSDVWSLGCILYLLIYKKTPFSHIKLLPQKITAITSPNTVIEYPPLPSFYPQMLVNMLKKCLIYNPKARSTAAELLKFPFNMVIPIDDQV
jgi:serine/threonine-protein kinase TTK/MPS1